MFNVIEEQLDTATLHFSYLISADLAKLENFPSESQDVIIAFTDLASVFAQQPFHYNPAIHQRLLDDLYCTLDHYSRIIKQNGTLYIYGLPQLLPYLSVYLNQKGWQFKYWLALETYHPEPTTQPLINTHEGILLYVRNKQKFSLRKTRSQHQKCDVCGDFTADWGGKSHLRHGLGYAISDVWDDLPQVKEKGHILSKEIWQRLILLTGQEHSKILIAAYDGIQDLEQYIFE